MIWTTLHDFYSVELFLHLWIICGTPLNYLCYAQWLVLRWMICTMLNGFYFLAEFLRPRMISTALKDLYYIEWFGVWWIICTTLNHLSYDELLSIGFLMSARCGYSKKYCKIFYSNLWVVFFLIWKYQEEIFSALPQKLVI